MTKILPVYRTLHVHKPVLVRPARHSMRRNQIVNNASGADRKLLSRSVSRSELFTCSGKLFSRHLPQVTISPTSSETSSRSIAGRVRFAKSTVGTVQIVNRCRVTQSKSASGATATIAPPVPAFQKWKACSTSARRRTIPNSLRSARRSRTRTFW